MNDEEQAAAFVREFLDDVLTSSERYRFYSFTMDWEANNGGAKATNVQRAVFMCNLLREREKQINRWAGRHVVDGKLAGGIPIPQYQYATQPH